ncbi:MAG: asparagine--tRNA ligase [Deltaproteobacteria bacterium]|nr:MAG: asparagine--tRNA ligase [Deltaproteobacteria bacterium]
MARIELLGEHEGRRVRLQGWLYNRRSSSKLHFLQVRDGTGIVQCVVARADVRPEVFQQAGELGQESSLKLCGTVQADRRAPGGFELLLDDLEVLQNVDGYPISPKEHGVAFLLEHRHLRLRSRRPHAVLRIRAELERACHDFLDAQGFLRLDTPILTPAACEGSTTLFETDYFGQKAFLTQSGQLYSEAGCQAFGRVYCFGPTFRAEKSKTRRHLMEFWMVEPEAAFLDLEGDIELAEGLVCALLERVLERCRPELETLERELAPLEAIARPFPRLTYAEAVQRLRKAGLAVEFGDDFGGDEETALSQGFERPLVIHRYPASLKPFYMKCDPEDPSVVLNMDILAPQGYGEIIGGSVREEQLDVLDAQMREKGVDFGPLEWYRDLRRYGSVPHAGFGLGLERTLTWICGLHHLRETIPFPRMLGRLHP